MKYLSVYDCSKNRAQGSKRVSKYPNLKIHFEWPIATLAMILDEGAYSQYVTARRIEHKAASGSQNGFLLDVKHQSLNILTLRMIDIYRMVDRLSKLMQDAYFTTGDSGGGKDGRAE